MSTGLYSGSSGLALGVGLYAGNPGLWGGGAGFDAGLQASLYLDFLAGAPLDSRITFTRGSNATLVDSTGKITYAPSNLVLRSEEFNDPAWVKSASSVTANDAISPDGTQNADLLVPDTAISSHFTRQQITATAGDTVTWSVFLKAGGYDKVNLRCANSGATLAFQVAVDLTTGTLGTASAYGSGAVVTGSSITNFGNGWYRVSLTGSVSGLVSYNGFVYVLDSSGSGSFAGDGTSGIRVWGAQLEPVTYQTTAGPYVATTASAYYGPRFDYDPVTLAPNGLLILEQRTNLLLQSQTFDNASWLRSDATVTADATTAPDGTSTADKLAETATTAGHYLYQNAGSAATHTATIYAKAAERSWIIVTLNSSNTFFNLSNGTVGSVPGGFTAAITAAGNGWYRCSVTATLPASGPIVFWASTANNVTSYAGTAGSGIFIWGAQLEAGAFATSYIPTVASQVTRSADVATMTGTNFSSWYNQSEGTFVVSGDRFSAVTYSAFVSAANAPSTNEIYITQASSQAEAYIVLASVAVGSMVGPSWPANTVGRAALAYQLNNAGLSYNGSAVVADTTVDIPTANRLQIGARATGAFILNGHIRQIAYYNTRLPNATLQALTA